MQSVILAFIVVFVSIPFVVTMLITILQSLWEKQIRLVTVYRGENNEVFKKIIDESENTLDIFDDQDCVYNDEEILDLIEKKLALFTEFTVTCLFNRKDRLTRFEERFSDHHRVNIDYRVWSGEDGEKEYYKIGDRGRFVCVTNGWGRDCLLYDFERVDQRLVSYFINIRFEKMLDRVRKIFGDFKVQQIFTNQPRVPFYFAWIVPRNN